MIRIKTLSLPLISAMVASTVAPASAQVELVVSSQKNYRQNKKDIIFDGGRFDVTLGDGDGVYVGGCARRNYWRPNIPLDPCPGGSTAYLIFGSFEGAAAGLGPYFWVETVIPSVVVEPRRPELAFLRAAPASTLPRPLGGFQDKSFALYFNLHRAASVREYAVALYDTTRRYTKDQRGKFEKDIVPGVYYYNFPRLNNPDMPAPITAVISPMAEGEAKLNNQRTGFKFTRVNDNVWTKDGFMELNYHTPNQIAWKALSPAVTYAAVDDLYFSIRVMQKPRNPKSPTDVLDNTTGLPSSIFPGFASGGDPRVLLRNPFVNKFTLPPIFEGGTRGVVEVQLQRAFRPSGVSYDFSTRKFQIPIFVANKYTDYAEFTFENGKVPNILADSDGDGFNNLNEWILDSDANEAATIPIEPEAAYFPQERDSLTLNLIRDEYFGFTVNQKLGVTPGVLYTLQRSKDGGRTWQKFVSDTDWRVRTVRLKAGAAPRRENTAEQVQIRVTAKDWVERDPITNLVIERHRHEQPPGTDNDRYRVKVTLRKKK